MAHSVNQYLVYDTIEKKAVPGEHNSSKVKEMLGMSSSVSSAASYGYLVKGRYRIFLLNSVQTLTFEEEWDQARFKILGVKR